MSEVRVLWFIGPSAVGKHSLLDIIVNQDQRPLAKQFRRSLNLESPMIAQASIKMHNTAAYGGSPEKLRQRRAAMELELAQVPNIQASELLIKWQLADNLEQLLTSQGSHELVILGPDTHASLASNLTKRGEPEVRPEMEVAAWLQAVNLLRTQDLPVKAWHCFKTSADHEWEQVGLTELLERYK